MHSDVGTGSRCVKGDGSSRRGQLVGIRVAKHNVAAGCKGQPVHHHIAVERAACVSGGGRDVVAEGDGTAVVGLSYTAGRANRALEFCRAVAGDGDGSSRAVTDRGRASDRTDECRTAVNVCDQIERSVNHAIECRVRSGDNAGAVRQDHIAVEVNTAGGRLDGRGCCDVVWGGDVYIAGRAGDPPINDDVRRCRSCSAGLQRDVADSHDLIHRSVGINLNTLCGCFRRSKVQQVAACDSRRSVAVQLSVCRNENSAECHATGVDIGDAVGIGRHRDVASGGRGNMGPDQHIA